VRGTESMQLVSHVSIELSFIIRCLLQAQPSNCITVQVTGPRKLENGLVVPGQFTAYTKSMAIGKRLKEQVLHVKDLCKYMDLDIVGCSLEEKKLISCIVKM